MQSDGTLPIEQRRNHKNVADAFIRIVRIEGIAAFSKEVGLTIVRV